MRPFSIIVNNNMDAMDIINHLQFLSFVPKKKKNQISTTTLSIFSKFIQIAQTYVIHLLLTNYISFYSVRSVKNQEVPK